MRAPGPSPTTPSWRRKPVGRLQPVVDTRELLEREGLPVEMVSVGSTYNYDIAQNISGVTEVQAGAYPLMDGRDLPDSPGVGPSSPGSGHGNQSSCARPGGVGCRAQGHGSRFRAADFGRNGRRHRH